MARLGRRVTVGETPASNPELRQAQVAKVAYELFEKGGRRHGCDWDDWFKAEKIVSERNGLSG